jgi:hypothetical protein
MKNEDARKRLETEYVVKGTRQNQRNWKDYVEWMTPGSLLRQACDYNPT